MDNFFEGLTYPQFKKALSTVSNKDLKRVVMEMELGTSNSEKNIRRLYNSLTDSKKGEGEHIDYLVNAIFVNRLSGGDVELAKKYRDIIVSMLDNFKISHDSGFIPEDSEKKALKKMKKIKIGHLEKFLKDKLDNNNKFEYMLVMRYFAIYRKLSGFQDLLSKSKNIVFLNKSE